MTALSRTARAVAVTGAAAAITLGMAACGASVVPKDQVASTISAELQKQGITTENLSCPGDLRAEVGESIRCEITAGEQPVDVVARVTSVEGSTVNYDITTEARPIAKALLEKQIGEQVQQQATVPVESTSCAGDLPPTVNQSVICTVTGGGETADLRVTVTGVDGGQINYSFEPA